MYPRWRTQALTSFSAMHMRRARSRAFMTGADAQAPLSTLPGPEFPPPRGTGDGPRAAGRVDAPVPRRDADLEEEAGEDDGSGEGHIPILLEHGVDVPPDLTASETGTQTQPPTVAAVAAQAAPRTASASPQATLSS